MLESCSEYCGYLAGVIGAFSFGSFGAPIKYISKLNVDPLVMQTYKSIVCFLTCWLVVFLGEPIKFSYWGILSGLFWVPGATAGIVGIRNAGLAISVGMWSCLNVISSFCWGLGVFHERVKSIRGAARAAFILIIGLIGMAYYSAPVKQSLKKESKSVDAEQIGKEDEEINLPLLKTSSLGEKVDLSNSYKNEELQKGNIEMTSFDRTKKAISRVTDVSIASREIISRRKKVEATDLVQGAASGDKQTLKEGDYSFFHNTLKISKRNIGLLGAAINGIWGSNSLIPLHYARKQGFHGAGYLISYSVGSMIVTVLLWVTRYLLNYFELGRDRMKAWNALPSFHIREMWIQGFLCGLLYSLGNFCSIIAVSSLGQGVGFSFIQTSMLVSGIWGVCIFKEIQGIGRIIKWLISSIITITGIVLLSREHAHVSTHRT